MKNDSGQRKNLMHQNLKQAETLTKLLKKMKHQGYSAPRLLKVN